MGEELRGICTILWNLISETARTAGTLGTDYRRVCVSAMVSILLSLYRTPIFSSGGPISSSGRPALKVWRRFFFFESLQMGWYIEAPRSSFVLDVCRLFEYLRFLR
jgi:hypothetical protein